MHRFYSASANFNLKQLSITDLSEIHHIKDVLRLRKGDLIQIFNSQNQEAEVILDSISDKAVLVLVKSVKEAPPIKVKITLACAPPKKDKYEWIIEKCTELGVDEIIPLKTKRGEVFFSSEKIAQKLLRFEKIIINAAKQSKRTKIPQIHPMMDLSKVLKSLDQTGLYLFPSLNGHSKHIKDVLSNAPDAQSITIFIGPEGDFTPEEVNLAVKNGCIPVSLGSTVLKVETAAIAAVSLVRFWYKG